MKFNVLLTFEDLLIEDIEANSPEEAERIAIDKLIMLDDSPEIDGIEIYEIREG